MKPNPVHRLPPPLEAAVQRLKLAARAGAERTVESLGLAALSASSTTHRDSLLAAQMELERKSAKFALTFNDALDERLVRELGRPVAGPSSFGAFGPSGGGAPPTRWDALTLVDDREVEQQIIAERSAQEMGQPCEWELRELETYIATLLDPVDGGTLKNPLRPEVIAHALMRGIDAVCSESDVRKALQGAFTRTLTSMLRDTYAQILSDLRRMGVQPVGLAVRNRPGAAAAGGPSGPVSSADSRAAALDTSMRGVLPPSRRDSGPGSFGHEGSASTPSGSGATLGAVDPALMHLLRRLAHSEPEPGGAALRGPGGHGLNVAESSLVGMRLENVIVAHRDELRQASRGGLDHMVIDVIGFLFDQILADPKVAPQMARQIARLQLPVLRAALGDPSFFSSRRHPVRRFVNRVATLGSAFEGFDTPEAQSFLAKVTALVSEVVEGEFDRIDVYERKLGELEGFVAEQAQQHLPLDAEAAALLAQKEDELLLRELYAQQLEGDLREVDGPPFVRDFLARVWSRVLLAAEGRGGAAGEQATRLRKTGRELMLSVQPKPTPAHRKAFLAELPKLMQELTEGMNLIAWPEGDRRAFFGQLMPAHADSLKAAAIRQLDLNLMARAVEGALQRPAPSRDALRNAGSLPVLSDEVPDPQLTREEAQRVGLLDEAAVDWNGQVDIDLGEEAPLPEQPQPPAPGLPALADAPDPVRGRALADTLQVGFAYQMHLNDQWQKVRLSHISPGRTFFMFTYGHRQRHAVSMTQRMLHRLCETGRLRAFEQATLLERATERARRQLARLAPAAGTGAGLAPTLGSLIGMTPRRA